MLDGWGKITYNEKCSSQNTMNNSVCFINTHVSPMEPSPPCEISTVFFTTLLMKKQAQGGQETIQSIPEVGLH